MMRSFTIFREAAIILLLSAFMGFVYTYATGKGFFAPSASSKVRPPVTAPGIIDLAKARELHESGSALFIDSRHEFDYRLGHIKGSYNLPLTDLNDHTDYIERLPRDRPIVTYCDGAQCNSSIELAAILQSRGFSNVFIFFGGWNEWKTQHLPLEGSRQ